MNLVRQAKDGNAETFFYTTLLDNRQGRRTVGKFLGAGWKTRKLGDEEMRLAADRGRRFDGSVSILIYVNPAFPDTEIRLLYLNPKGEPGIPDEKLTKVVEISVMSLEADKK